MFFAFDILNTGQSLHRGGDGGDYAGKLEWAKFRAMAHSAFTCEDCGKPGRLVVSGRWYHTACDDHLRDGVPVGSGDGGILQAGGKQYRFDVDLDNFVEIAGDVDDG